MTTEQKLEPLIASVESAVKSALAYFEGPGANSKVKVGTWTPREVLCHMIYWHQATLDGMESVARGGEPYRIYADTDEMNARAVGRASGKSVKQLVDEARQLQARLVAASRKMPDLNATVVIRGDGTEQSARQRLERIAHHWNEHIQELKNLGTGG